MNERLRKVGASGRAAVLRGVRQVADPSTAAGRVVPDAVRRRIPGARRRLPTGAVAVLDRLSGRTSGVSASLLAQAARRPEVPDTPIRLWVGPANFAGQGWWWADALSRHVEGVGARAMAVAGPLRFRVDYEVDPDVYRHIQWQRDQERYVTAGYTHALIEAERPLFGPLYGRTCAGELDRLAAAGLTVGLISHGSDLRIPSRHADSHPHSPFADPSEKLTGILQARAEKNAQILSEFAAAGGATFVSTPDLLDDAPAARWAPVVVDPGLWASDWPVMARRRPQVVHVPSNGRLKGSELIDPIMTRLHDEGLVEYSSLRRLPHPEIRRCYQEADIVLDQFVLGLYGVAAVEALAAGRVVVAYVGDVVRQRVREATGLEVPIVEATPDTLEQVVRDLVADPERARSLAAAGPEFARAVHDGRYSAEVLSALTGGETRPREAVPAGPSEGTLSTLPMRPAPDRDADVRLWIGPANFAGQGHAWARVVERELGVSARAMGVARGFTFPADYTLDQHPYNRDPHWGLRTEHYLRDLYTHVIIEAGRPVTGFRSVERSAAEVETLRAAGVKVAHLFHGTEARLPSRHAALFPQTSPFTDTTWEVVPKMEAFAVKTLAAIEHDDAPVFVSTPDLLDYVPRATWCPVVVEPERWRSEAGVLGRDVPVVAHAPSQGRLKGSELIDPILARLDEQGRISYRRIQDVPWSQMPSVYTDADIVVDQIVLGLYGVAACEAMAAGRLTLAFVGDAIRDRVRDATGWEVPIVEVTPSTLEDVLLGLLHERGAARETAARGPEFVADVHDGRRSAAALSTFLG